VSSRASTLVGAGALWRTAVSPQVIRFAAIVFCGLLPAITLVVLFATAVQDDAVAVDLRPHYSAAQAVLDGDSPYPSSEELRAEELRAYVYPPLLPLLTVPLTALPFDAAGLVFMALLVAAAVAIPFVLGVRDWRCYGVLFLWPPILSAIQTGNITLLFGLCAALLWRFRDRTHIASASLGVTLAAKFFLWPLVVWLAATRRIAAAGLACVVGAGLLLLSWAAIGFAGLVDYPDLMRRLDNEVGDDSYTLQVVASDLGAPDLLARGLWLAFALALLGAVIWLGRRREDRAAFIVGIAATLALSPIVWLHYFALLLVVVALAQPRLTALWFVPLLFVLTPGSGQPTPFETAWTLAVAAAIVAIATSVALGVVRRRRMPASVETIPALPPDPA
jgi:Glycosyltransferase family 87